MTQSEYIQKLRKELTVRGVKDIDDIVAEYEQHFVMKKNDGYTEDEIAAKLGAPGYIAEQFGSENETEAKNISKNNKLLIGSFIWMLDIAAASVFIALYSWVIVMGAFSVSSVLLGFFVGTGIRFNEAIIPYMPSVGGIVLGVSFLALSILSAIGTIYSHFYVIQIAKKYLRWHRNIFSTNQFPPLSFNPNLSGKFKRRTRLIAIISAIAFAVTFAAANIVLFAYAEYKPYWHEWGWFL
jgi:uncharacterized membrane protein